MLRGKSPELSDAVVDSFLRPELLRVRFRIVIFPKITLAREKSKGVSLVRLLSIRVTTDETRPIQPTLFIQVPMLLLNQVFTSVDRQTDCWLSDPESLRKSLLTYP